MASELQRIVDGIAERLRLAAAIDDTRLRLQVYSPHVGPVDKTRLESILHREAPAPVREWARAQGIERAMKPFRLEGPAPGLEEFMPRIGAPIRAQGMLLGFLWVIDPDGRADDAGLGALQEAADAAGVVMYRERLVDELHQTRRREVLRDLLWGDDAEVELAGVRAREDGLLQTGLPRTLVVAFRSPTAAHDDVRLAMEHAVGRCLRTHEDGRVLGLVRADHAVLVASDNESRIRREGFHHLAEEFRDEVVGRTTLAVQDLVAGIGPPAPTLAGLRGSYVQAKAAVRVARAIASFDGVADSDRLGIYGLLCKLPAEELTPDLLPGGLRVLLEEDGDRVLLSTLETYLDLSGDAKGTSETLAIHRTSLYYRLKRVQEIAEADLSVGEDRLALHIGLKTARFLGLW